ncbi:FecR family protein [Mangrovibacterium diazotrophicum]|uniref:FecR family protein n=1 Tax=Mangrovibacterium diazotrophicum TaxID=1261403 RepID=A0A419VW35_9BACT|nr:FecR domain-containing protein [Mangrovibacterium diazotrophicum]RKD86370.1 FecR family protein [Mangrovibacterium diazotrophicum]
MANNTSKENLRRFREDLATEKEMQDVSSRFSEGENDSELRQQVYSDFEQYIDDSPIVNFNLNYLLDRIHHTIHKRENRKKRSTVQRIYTWYSASAAVILIPLLIAGFLWYLGQNRGTSERQESVLSSTLFAPMGARINFTLPDGSSGWLNSGSSLQYEIPFQDNRQVVVSGEAWFDVAHDASHPFEVTAGSSKVKVLGTKFNVNAYPGENYIEVVLEEGKVEFSSDASGTPVILKPDERLVYTDSSIQISQADATKYSGWKEGKLIFRGDPMIDVAERIGRWYDVEIEIVDKDLEQYAIRGIFQDDSLEEVLQYLSMTSPITYKVKNREILKDGTFDKKKVYLYLKK